MKKFICLLIFLIIGICTPAIGAELGNFEHYHDQTNGFLNQEDNLPTFEYSCGPMAVIIGQNYFERKYTIATYQTFSTLYDDLVDAYNRMNIVFNTTVGVYNLYDLLDDLCFSPNLHVGYGTSATERDRAHTKIKQEIGNDRVVICFLSAGSTLLNSYIRYSGVNHAIVVYGTYSSGTADYVKYVDPWDGLKKQVSASAFKSALYLGDWNDFVSFDN